MVVRVCKQCGLEYETKPSARLLYCGAACYTVAKRGAGNPKWRGGTFVSRGYIYQYAPNHPSATKAGYVRQHRLVMEALLGRYLQPFEVVHHKNEQTADNRPENLLLCASPGAHAAQFHTAPRNRVGKFGQTSAAANPNQKLTDAQVCEVLRHRSMGLTYAAIAKLFAVSVSCIAFICTGRSRRSVTK